MAKIITHDAAIARLRKLQAGRTLREFAVSLGCSPMYLSDIYRGKRGLGDGILKHLKLAKVPPTEPTYIEVRE